MTSERHDGGELSGGRTTSPHGLPVRSRALRRDPRRRADRWLPLRRIRRGAVAGSALPPPRRRPLARRRAAHGRARGRARARATYFLMTASVFYNLASRGGSAAITRLRELGHAVGLHAIHPDATLDERFGFDPVLAWHNPDPRVHDGAGRGRRERDAGRRGSTRPPTAPTPTSTGAPAARTTTSARGRSPGSSSSCTRRSGSTRARRWARRCARCSTPSGSGASPAAADRIDSRASAWSAHGAAPPIDPAPHAARRTTCFDSPMTLRPSPSSSPPRARPARPPCCAACARTASASSAWSAPTCRALRRPAPLRRLPPRPGRCRPGLRRRGARRRRAGARRRRPAAVVVRSRGAGGAPRALPRAGARLEPGCDPSLERQGRDLRVPPSARAAGAGLPPGQRRRRGRARRARARLPRPAGLLQARVLVGLARVQVLDPTVDRAHQLLNERPGLGRDAARGGGRAAPRRRRARSARDGAGDRRRAHDRRDRRRTPGRPRPPEDPRGDARRARDVLRHARRSGS